MVATVSMKAAMPDTLILLSGWCGFNAASTFAATDIQFAAVAVDTATAGALGAVFSMFCFGWRRWG